MVSWRWGNARLLGHCGILDLCVFKAGVEWEVAFSQQVLLHAATEAKHNLRKYILLQEEEKMGLKP